MAVDEHLIGMVWETGSTKRGIKTLFVERKSKTSFGVFFWVRVSLFSSHWSQTPGSLSAFSLPSANITGMSHHAWLGRIKFERDLGSFSDVTQIITVITHLSTHGKVNKQNKTPKLSCNVSVWVCSVQTHTHGHTHAASQTEFRSSVTACQGLPQREYLLQSYKVSLKEDQNGSVYTRG